MTGRSPLRFGLLILAVVFTVVGARWQWVARFGSPVPFQDQWYAEGEDLYLAHARGDLPVARFFQPHNDHRIVPTRLLAYALFRANGQWDVRLQMAVNAFLAAGLAALLLGLVRPWTSDTWLTVAALLLAGFYAVPVVYENALWGFQSAFYFLGLFSLAHLWLVLGRPPGTPAWWLGVAAGIAALGTMGSGLLAPAAVGVVSAWRAWREPSARRAAWGNLAVAIVLVVAGAWWLPPRLGSAAAFQLGPFMQTLGHALDFPRRGSSLFGIVLWLPFLAVGVNFLRSRETSTPLRVLVATGVWVVLQCFAIGIARPETGPVLANRYGEILTIGLAVNLASLLFLWSHGWKRFMVVATVVWIGGVAWLTRDTVAVFRREISPQILQLRDEQLGRVNAFVRSHETTAVTTATYPHIPVVNAASLARDLSFPELRDLLPFEMRPPVALDFPATPALANAVPVSLPNEAGALHRGTFLKGEGAAAEVMVTSQPASKHPGLDLVFKVAGDFKAGETELRIRDASGAVAATITDLKSDVLRPVTVRVPGRTFAVEVYDRSPARWIAFLDPVEIGPLSELTLRALTWGPALEIFGWVMLAAVGLWTAFARVLTPGLGVSSSHPSSHSIRPEG